MADNLSISITADTASLRAQLAQAQADVRAYGAEVRKLADTLRSAGADAKGGLQAELQSAAGKLGQATSAAAALRGELRAGAAAHQEHAAGLKGITEALSGLTSPIGNTIGGLREIAEITGVAFAAEKLGEFVKEMAELGEKTENTAAALGISAEKYSLMSRAMQLVGGDAELAARGLIILQTKLVEAVENPASKAREAFLAMGISLDEMKAGLADVPAFLLRYADGFKAMGEGAARTAALHDTLGRSMKGAVPYLRDGADGIRRLNEEAKNTGAPFSEDEVKRLAELGKEINTLGEDFDGLRKAIVLGLIDPIEQGVSKVSELIEQMTKLAAARDVVGVIRLIDPGDVEAIEKIGAGWERFKRYWDDTQEGLGHGRPSGTLPEGAASAELPPKPLPTTQPGAGFGTRAQREGPPEPAAPEAKAAPPVDPAVEQKDLAREIKGVTDALKLEEAQLDVNIAKAKGNQAAIEDLEKKSSLRRARRPKTSRRSARNTPRAPKGAATRSWPTSTAPAAARSRSKTSSFKSSRSKSCSAIRSGRPSSRSATSRRSARSQTRPRRPICARSSGRKSWGRSPSRRRRRPRSRSSRRTAPRSTGSSPRKSAPRPGKRSSNTTSPRARPSSRSRPPTRSATSRRRRRTRRSSARTRPTNRSPRGSLRH